MKFSTSLRSGSVRWAAPVILLLTFLYYVVGETAPLSSYYHYAPSLVAEPLQTLYALAYAAAAGLACWESGRLRSARIWALAADPFALPHRGQCPCSCDRAVLARPAAPPGGLTGAIGDRADPRQPAAAARRDGSVRRARRPRIRRRLLDPSRHRHADPGRGRLDHRRLHQGGAALLAPPCFRTVRHPRFRRGAQPRHGGGARAAGRAA